ncbi:MAG: glycosyltransferase family 2 protein [Chloroflexi bacterium]|nr:glycosyltransferase family 2 protein [Chloroflexota bacterium]MBI3740581.1 glycosyltransferase family 2 protein [Chloroflexota bacterium]
MTLSVVILTRNEEKHIRDCLASVREFADELLVLDSSSPDRTVEIARECGARVEQRAFDNYAAQRNAAIELARGEWIFFMDADERATPELGKEILESVHRPSSVVGFWVARRNIIFGKEIKHTGWSPDYQPRVLKKGFGKFDPTRHVHELLVWEGRAGVLKAALIHYNYDSLTQFRAKQIAYTRYEAQVWFGEGKRARVRGFIGQPLREIWRRYIILEGWKDGAHGFWLSALMAYYAFVRQKMFWEMHRKHRV